MTITTKIHTWLNGIYIGEDQFGNKYYEHKKVNKTSGRKKRWVIYKGLPEASKVPAEWHGWLHYTFDTVPKKRYKWQKQHMPNLTGTELAYRPPGHILKGGKRDKAIGDYQAWEPK